VSTYWDATATEMRLSREYVQYYILITNMIFMGVLPCLVMATFNVLVVKAVDEANKRRARISKRLVLEGIQPTIFHGGMMIKGSNAT